MSILKCKICGGDLNIHEGSVICRCEYCGTAQTIPISGNEKKINLYNRANRLRMNAEFDKASAVYTSILAESPREAEAYWGLCLCKYGIEYVDDPQTAEKVPTCHRTLLTSILDDDDYLHAVEYADPSARSLYKTEARRIDELQQRILHIVKNEAPYDVFICYKETDDNGDRTEDSVIAHDIYDALTNRGLKVFFARITLEDKIGQEYEPYIYAALQSARVMLLVCTSFDNLDAAWVKNEWSRFLDLMKTDRSKILAPCYKGFEIEEMPRSLQRLQCQDLSKLGWIQDLTRGVMKICRNGTPKDISESVNEKKSVQPRDEKNEQRTAVKRDKINTEKKSTGKTFAKLLHILNILFISILTNSFSPANNSLMSISVISMFVLPVFIWKADKKKSTKHVLVDILLCFVAIIAIFYAIAGKINMYIGIISTWTFIVLNILF